MLFRSSTASEVEAPALHLLPPSAAAELNSQHATKHGQLFFELSAADGRRTHAAILDYSAEEGTVGCPPELLRCLGLAQEQLPVDQASRHLVSAEPPVEEVTDSDEDTPPPAAAAGAAYPYEPSTMSLAAAEAL